MIKQMVRFITFTPHPLNKMNDDSRRKKYLQILTLFCLELKIKDNTSGVEDYVINRNINMDGISVDIEWLRIFFFKYVAPNDELRNALTSDEHISSMDTTTNTTTTTFCSYQTPPPPFVNCRIPCTELQQHRWRLLGVIDTWVLILAIASYLICDVLLGTLTKNLSVYTFIRLFETNVNLLIWVAWIMSNTIVYYMFKKKIFFTLSAALFICAFDISSLVTVCVLALFNRTDVIFNPTLFSLQLLFCVILKPNVYASTVILITRFIIISTVLVIYVPLSHNVWYVLLSYPIQCAIFFLVLVTERLEQMTLDIRIIRTRIKAEYSIVNIMGCIVERLVHGIFLVVIAGMVINKFPFFATTLMIVGQLVVRFIFLWIKMAGRKKMAEKGAQIDCLASNNLFL